MHTIVALVVVQEDPHAGTQAKRGNGAFFENCVHRNLPRLEWLGDGAHSQHSHFSDADRVMAELRHRN